MDENQSDQIEKLWFFDLEETIIESWDNPQLCNFDKVSKFIRDNNIKNVNIFSAAIWSDEDKSKFESEFKGWLENVFNINIVSWPSMSDVWHCTQWKMTKFESVAEMIVILGKKRMFEDWCKAHFNDVHCVLLDDSFGDEILINKQSNLMIEVIDVTKLRV